MMRSFLLLPCILVSQSLFAGDRMWLDLDQPYQERQSSTSAPVTIQDSRSLELDISKLTQLLTSEPALSKAQKYLELPLPNGQQMLFRVEPSNVMAPELAKRYPNIRTWKVTNPENPGITGRIELSPQGFHGLINLDGGGRVFIDPNKASGLNHYVSSSTYESIDRETDDDSRLFASKQSPNNLSSTLFAPSADTLVEQSATSPHLTYRVAIATTAEYTQLSGGTKNTALAAVVTTVNRLNQVFERDLNLTLELIENTDKLLYTSPSSDPYSNEDAVAMIDENIVNINAVIGADNYDIGHVFGTGNTGSLAYINSACGTYKAGGATGSNTPFEESFYIDYVAHEIGRQLGASKTFNGQQLNCSGANRKAETAVEPGSGSSIMGYAGICGTDNLQTNSDAFFHSVSIKQINTFTRRGSGSTCGTASIQNNNVPVVSAGPDYNIPAETPFKLTGVANDIDADILLHSWEQIDVGSAGGLYTDLGDNPLFRVWPPVSSTSRFFPKLDDILNQTSTIGELLPTTDREMNFTLLTRDNKGGVSQDNMTLTVINTGAPFTVLSHATPTTFTPNQSITVLWDVANTTEPPISCSHVDIGLLNNDGVTFTLASNTLNDGQHDLIVPSNIDRIQNVSIQISCVDNVFFAVSNGKIDVLGDDPVISVDQPSIIEGDNGVSQLTFIISLSAIARENIVINYDVTDSASSAIVQEGTVMISKDSNTAKIEVQVVGDILHESDQILNLSLKKPVNAQFANDSSELISQGTIVDDDVALTTEPETPETTVSNSVKGGGSLSLLSIIGLLLLSIRRFKPSLLNQTERRY